MTAKLKESMHEVNDVSRALRDFCNSYFEIQRLFRYNTVLIAELLQKCL